MLIKAAKLQDVLENEQLTEVKQGHHQLRKLCKYINNLELLKKIWQKASDNDLKRVLNMADVVTAIDEYIVATSFNALVSITNFSNCSFVRVSL